MIGLMVVLTLIFVLPVQSQDVEPETPYLIQMLSMIPAEAGTVSPEGRLDLWYADLQANRQARPGVPIVTNHAEFKALDPEAIDLWGANLRRLVTTAPDIQNVAFLGLEEMSDYYGFNYFQIDRSLYFGPPPYHGTIYGGHFDVDRIAETMISRTYTATELNGISVLCGPVGCENGMEPNQWLPDQLGPPDPSSLRRQGRFPIFSGRLGYQQPIALLPGYLLSSPDWGILGEMTAVTSSGEESLYDVPEYRTIADFAVTGLNPETDGTLIQVLFFPPYFYFDLLELLQSSGLDNAEQIAAEVTEIYGIDEEGNSLSGEPLPTYAVGAIVDRQEGTEQVYSLVLVYTNEADAQQAAAEVVRRIPLHIAFDWGVSESLIDYILSEYTLDPPQVVHNPETNEWLAIATIRVPMPDNTPSVECNNRICPTSLLLEAWVISMNRMSFFPVQLPLPPE
jgi:hypothetical protein